MLYKVVHCCTLLYNVKHGCKTVVHGCVVYGCKRLYTVLQCFKRLYMVNKIVYCCKVGYGCKWLCTRLSKTVNGGTRFYSVVQGCTLFYNVVQGCKTVVHDCTQLYNVLQCCTWFTRMYTGVRGFTQLYMTVQRLYNICTTYAQHMHNSQLQVVPTFVQHCTTL